MYIYHIIYIHCKMYGIVQSHETRAHFLSSSNPQAQGEIQYRSIVLLFLISQSPVSCAPVCFGWVNSTVCWLEFECFADRRHYPRSFTHGPPSFPADRGFALRPWNEVEMEMRWRRLRDDMGLTRYSQVESAMLRPPSRGFRESNRNLFPILMSPMHILVLVQLIPMQCDICWLENCSWCLVFQELS